MEIRRFYQIGHFYEEYQNLEKVGNYRPVGFATGDRTVAIYQYTDRFHKATLRFNRVETETGFRWRLTEIFDTYQQKGLIEIPTVSKPNHNKSLGDKVMDAFERIARL